MRLSKSQMPLPFLEVRKRMEGLFLPFQSLHLNPWLLSRALLQLLRVALPLTLLLQQLLQSLLQCLNFHSLVAKRSSARVTHRSTMSLVR